MHFRPAQHIIEFQEEGSMAKNIIHWAIGVSLVFAGIAGFSVYQFIVSLHRNAGLQSELAQVKEDIAQLELVRDNLSSDLEKAQESGKALFLENTGLKDELIADKERFAMLETTIAEAQNDIDEMNAEISVARQENIALVSQIDGLKTRLSTVSQEKDRMALTLNSVDEMKKAIKELRRKTRQARRSAPVTIVADAKKQVREISLGNKGFIIRDGKLLTPARVVIEVQPSPEHNQ